MGLPSDSLSTSNRTALIPGPGHRVLVVVQPSMAGACSVRLLRQVRGVLSRAVPRARGVALAVGRVGEPGLGLLRDLLDLVDAHQPIPRKKR